METLSSYFSNAQGLINELENKPSNQDVLIFKKREKNMKMMQKINDNLPSKDKWIVEMEESMGALNDMFDRLSVKLDKVKLIIMDTY